MKRNARQLRMTTSRTVIRTASLLALGLALAACVSTAPPVKPPVDTTTPAQRMAAVDASAGKDDKELDVQPLRDAGIEDLRVVAKAKRQANDLTGAAEALDQALLINEGCLLYTSDAADE